MKKNKFLTLVVCLLLGSMLFCSCGGSKAPKAQDVFSGKFADDSVAYTQGLPVSMDATEVISTGEKFITFCKPAKELTQEEQEALGINFTIDQETYTVYNMESNSSVATFKGTLMQKIDQNAGVGDQVTTSLYNVYYESVNGFGLFALVTSEFTHHIEVSADGTSDETKTTVLTTTLYDEKGTVIDTVKDENTSIRTTGSDLFLFNGACYRVNAEGTACEKLFDTDLKQVPASFEAYTSEYYYTTTNGTYYVYDRDLALLSSYTLPSYAKAVAGADAVMPMADGNLYVQYLIALPADAKDYDLYDGEEKYDMVTEIFDVKKGTSKALKTSTVLLGLVPVYSGDKYVNSDDAWNMYTDRVENLVMYVTVENGNLNTASASCKIGSMDSKGKLVFCLSDLFENMSGMPEMISNARMIYTSVSGQKYLASTSGEVLGEVTNMRAMTAKYIVSDRKLYDYNLKVAYNYAESGMMLYRYTDSAVFFEKGKAIYIFEGSSVRELIKASSDAVLIVADGYYVVGETVGVGENAKTAYTYYTVGGEVLMQADELLEQIGSYGDVAIFRSVASDSGKVSYYRFTV